MWPANPLCPKYVNVLTTNRNISSAATGNNHTLKRDENSGLHRVLTLLGFMVTGGLKTLFMQTTEMSRIYKPARPKDIKRITA
jgi:hypothetical protein